MAARSGAPRLQLMRFVGASRAKKRAVDKWFIAFADSRRFRLDAPAVVASSDGRGER